jgi:tetratricopeptide (TPR) repeat protein
VGRYRLHLPVILTLAYMAYLVLSFQYEGAGFKGSGVSPYHYLMTQFNVHWTYVRLLLLPMGQNLDYDYPVAGTLFEARAIISLLGYAGLWAAGLYAARRRPVLGFPVLWFLITLTPSSSVVPLDDVIFEHRVYLASAGFFALMTGGVFYMAGRLSRAAGAAALMLALLCLALGGAAHARNAVWQDGVSLWEDVISKSPNKARGHNNLGDEYHKKGLFGEAEESYKRVLGLRPDLAEAWYNLGCVYVSLGRTDEAAEHYLAALRLKPDFPQAYNNLGNVYLGSGRPDEAIECFQAALRLTPALPALHLGIAEAYAGKELPDEAIKHFLRVIELAPEDLEAYIKLAVIYTELGDAERAEEYIRMAGRLEEKADRGR